MRHVIAFSALFSFGLFSAGCFLRPATVDPPPAPSRTIPALRVDPGPVPDDKGRVVLDAVDRPSKVEEVLATTDASAVGPGGSAFAHGDTTRPVCQTPCAADLPRGAHRLRFTPVDEKDDWNDEFMVDVGTKPSIFRVAPGYLSENWGLKTAGLLLAMTGVAGLAVGGPVWAASASRPTPDGDAVRAGMITVGVSAAAVALGLALTYLGRGEKQPSTTTQWTPSQTTGNASASSIGMR